MVKIAGSFLKIQDDNKKIKELEKVTDLIHYDVMDGKFTEKATRSVLEMKDVVTSIKKPVDIHLMVKDIKKYIDEVALFKPLYITFHFEGCNDVIYYINYIHSKGINVGIAINPGTKVEDIYPYLDKVDLVLVMSVQAGAGGQKFIDITDKLDKLIKYRQDNGLNYLLEVDGGINDSTVNLVKNADIVVVGSFITSSENYQSMVYKLKKALRNGFTLAELLGVIVILSILGLIAATAIDSNLREGRYDTCVTQRTNLIESAKTATIDYPELLPSSGERRISVQVLHDGGNIDGIEIKGGYVEDNFTNPMTEKLYIDSNVDVVISTNNGTNFKYEVEFANPDEDCHK